MLTTPAGCGAEVVLDVVWLVAPGALASGAPMVLNSTPEEAVVSFDTMVLLTMLTSGILQRDAGAVPARHVVDDDVVGDATEFQSVGLRGEQAHTSVPLTDCRRMPPPLPLPRALPMIRLALITRPGRCRPEPGRAVGVGDAAAFDARGGEAVRRRAHDHDAAAVGRNGRVGALVEQDLVVLDVTVVAEADVRKPPPSPVLRLPQTQL